MLKPTSPVSTFRNGLGVDSWAGNRNLLVMPPTPIYHDAMARQFYQNRLNKMLRPRGGEWISSKMWELLGYTTEAVIPYGVQVINQVAGQRLVKILHDLGYKKTSCVLQVFLIINRYGVVGLSTGPINRIDQIKELALPTRENDPTCITAVRNNTDILFSFAVSQIVRKQKHYFADHVEGQGLIASWIYRMLERILDPNTELYPVEFNAKYAQSQDGLVALARNETHNYAVIFLLGHGAKFLNDNLTLSPQAKMMLNFVEAKFHTAYNLTEPQMKKLFDEKRIQ